LLSKEGPGFFGEKGKGLVFEPRVARKGTLPLKWKGP